MTEPIGDDTGLGLIELIVALLVSTVVLIAVATILVNSWLTQQDVTSTTEATTRGQLIGQSIERAMRNAVAFDISPDGRMLRVHTTLGSGRECQAFWMTGGASYMTSSAGPLPGAVVTAWPRAWEPDGVIQSGTTPFFEQSGLDVTYTFDIATDSAPVGFLGQVSMRTPATGATLPCWS